MSIIKSKKKRARHQSFMDASNDGDLAVMSLPNKDRTIIGVLNLEKESDGGFKFD